MFEIWEYLQLTFVQRAIIGGIFIAGLAGLMGVFTTMRGASFFGDAVAHSSLAGVAIGLLFDINPLLTAFVYAVIIALILPWLKQKTDFSFDNLLGIFLPLSMGLGVVIFATLPGYQPELISFLFGSMLAITWTDVGLIIVLSSLVGALMMYSLKKLSFVAIDPEYAKLSGIKIQLFDFLYHFLLALTIVSGVRLVGVILINALLIIPASIVKLYAQSLRQMFIFTPIIGIVCLFLGIVLSIIFNAPSGATIAVVSGGLFLISLMSKKIFIGNS